MNCQEIVYRSTIRSFRKLQLSKKFRELLLWGGCWNHATPKPPPESSRIAGEVAAVRPDALTVVTCVVYPRPGSSLSAATSEPSAAVPISATGCQIARLSELSRSPRIVTHRSLLATRGRWCRCKPPVSALLQKVAEVHRIVSIARLSGSQLKSAPAASASAIAIASCRYRVSNHFRQSGPRAGIG